MISFSLKGQHQEIELREGDVIVGRSSECDVQVEGEAVSRKHARIAVRSGAVFVEDMGSRNGTFVNGRRIAERTQVSPGDAVQFGEAGFELLAAQPAEARTVVMSRDAAPKPSVEPPSRPAAAPPSEPIIERAPQPSRPAAPPPPPPRPAPLSASSASAVEQRYASIASRALAQFIDGLAAFGVFFFVGMSVAPRFGGRTEAGFDLTGAPALIVIAVVTAILFAYFVLLEAALGATFGKLAAGIRVRGVDGGRVGIGASLIRNLLRIVDGIGVYLVGGVVALLTKRKQRLGDLAARTVVIEHDWGGGARVAGVFAAVAIGVGGIVGGFLTAPSMQAKAPPVDERIVRRGDQKTQAGAGPQRGAEAPPVQQAQPAAVPGGMMTSAVMTSRISDSHEPLAAADRFPAGQHPLYLAFKAVNLPRNSVIKGVLVAEDVGGAAPPESRLAETSVAAADGGSVPGHFQFTLNPAWVPGRYRIELYINDRPAQTVRFAVAP